MKRWGIIALVLVLLSAGAVLAIWQPWENKKNDKPQTDNSQYLVIKEWGLRMKLNDNIRDARYSFDNEFHSMNLVYLTTDSINKIPGCETTKVLLAIPRSKEGETLGTLTASDKLVPPMIKIDNYYYLNTGPSYNCGQGNRNIDDQNREAATKAGEVKNGLREAFKTLEKIPGT